MNTVLEIDNSIRQAGWSVVGNAGDFSSEINSLPDSVDRFLAIAASHPSATAVVEYEGATTYGMLEDRVRALAAVFAEQERPKVLIVLPPGVDAYAVMLAAGLAGGFYAPLNVNSPSSKWLHVCGLLQPDFIVGPSDIVALLAQEAPHARGVDVASCASGPRFAGRGARHETAYVIFTSGSTGTPKGVVVARSGLDHYVNWIGTSLQVGSSDRVSQYANVAFDLSVLEIYGALCFGASLHPAGGLGDRMMPARMVEREQLTIWISVPSVVGLMMQANEVTQENLGSIRRFVFCGEPLLGTQVEALFSACPDATVQNTYGPTEATVSMTSVVMTADSFAGECGSSVALGDPIKGMNLLLLGGPSADEGEIVIVGPQVALGYWQDPVKTDKAFRTVVQDGKVCRAYFTGDWAERREGRIFFKQRIDFQVKIKGFRIELDEIAAAIVASGFPNVCVFKHNERLVAVIEASASSPFNDRALHQVLARRLESYAIPQDLRVIRRLPRNDNDKIDRELTRNWYASLTQATPAAPVLEAGVVAVEADRSASLNLLINLASPGQGNS